ncbi:MaoC family dehydratase N-terminal domain-containing protein [Mycobacterium sp. NAZ190054]|uniref:FAS1-like dehydratase domain-containing protein n=1 Tax=Mycobacterium sp. NAZ190054 TaxID=1747766 RepID=UPI0018D24366|nr:MaoC family dehydratase N-terminal domain-containing protein [Mycobacterium sp. NAZ190054]
MGENQARGGVAMLNPIYQGRVYPPTPEYQVSREKIREFADAINDGNPVYRDAAAAQKLGYPDVIAPPTFAAVLTLPAGHQVTKDCDFISDFSQIVHGEQRFEYVRPIYAGDRLQVVVTVESVRQAGRNGIAVIRSAVSTVDGMGVVVSYSTTIVRGGS